MQLLHSLATPSHTLYLAKRLEIETSCYTALASFAVGLRLRLFYSPIPKLLPIILSDLAHYSHKKIIILH